MFKRLLFPKVELSLQHSPAVALLGPRQIGKTTLALSLAEAQTATYLDLESPSDLAKLDDAENYLKSHAGKLVILDEIQRVPELFQVLRGIIDQNRRQGNANGQFLFLGSASPDLLRQSAESLAGRIVYHELAGLTPLEVQADTQTELEQLWLRGGFPDSYSAASIELSSEWRENFIRTYLERDIPQLGARIPAHTMRRLWTMLAHQQGSINNASKLGNNLDLATTTINRYIDLLVDVFMVRRLQPWHSNTKKRLVKSPKLYLRDSGLLHQLLGLSSLEDLQSNPVIGQSWEGFVIENILNVVPKTAEAFFYRTSAGAEIDLLLKLPKNELWAIEIKRTSAPKLSQGFHNACDDVNPTRKFVVYNGNEHYTLKHEVEALSLMQLQQEIYRPK